MTAKELLRALQKIGPKKRDKGDWATLNGIVKIYSRDGLLKLLGFNHGSQIQLDLGAGAGSTHVNCLVNGWVLMRLVKALPSKSVVFLSLYRDDLVIATTDCTLEMALYSTTLDAAPDFGTEGYAHGEVLAEHIEAAIALSPMAAWASEIRKALQCINVEERQMVATDGYTMGFMDIPDGAFPQPFMAKPAFFKTLKSLASGNSFQMYINGRTVICTGEGFQYRQDLGEPEKYPPWQKVVSEPTELAVMLARSPLVGFPGRAHDDIISIRRIGHWSMAWKSKDGMMGWSRKIMDQHARLNDYKVKISPWLLRKALRFVGYPNSGLLVAKEDCLTGWGTKSLTLKSADGHRTALVMPVRGEEYD